MKGMIKRLKELIFWKLRGEIPIWAYVKRGLKVGGNFSMEPGCSLDYPHCWLIEIGDDVTLAPKVHILAHDASTKRALDYTKIGRVAIGSRVFIGANTIILPNINIGNDVIVGAGSVVTKNLPHGCIAVGNPARIIGYTNDYLANNKKLMEIRPKFEEEYTILGGIKESGKAVMKEQLENGIGFVK
jgi:maltose O-acetyltransferase